MLFLDGELKSWFLVCSCNVVSIVWQWWKWCNSTVLVHCCVNIVLESAPMLTQWSGNIVAMLWQFWKLHNFTMLCQHYLNVLVWSDFNAGHWHSHNIHITLPRHCECCDITLFPMLYQRFGNIVKLRKFQHCGNAAKITCGMNFVINIVTTL